VVRPYCITVPRRAARPRTRDVNSLVEGRSRAASPAPAPAPAPARAGLGRRLLAPLLQRALADPLPARLEDGGGIAAGFDGELDA
jgi:DNA mismatch repair protein MutS